MTAITTTQGTSQAAPTVELNHGDVKHVFTWGTARTHKLAVGDTVLVAGQTRTKPSNPAEGTVIELSQGPVIRTKDGASGIGGGVATRFWAVKIAAAKPAKAAAKKAPAKPAAKKAPAKAATSPTARAAKARATHAEAIAAGDTRTCNTCNETKPMTAFPTAGHGKDGAMKRGPKCRACRDAK